MNKNTFHGIMFSSAGSLWWGIQNFFLVLLSFQLALC